MLLAVMIKSKGKVIRRTLTKNSASLKDQEVMKNNTVSLIIYIIYIN